MDHADSFDSPRLPGPAINNLSLLTRETDARLEMTAGAFDASLRKASTPNISTTLGNLSTGAPTGISLTTSRCDAVQ